MIEKNNMVLCEHPHNGRQRHTQVERRTFAKRNHNNGLTYGKQHPNTQADLVKIAERGIKIHRLDNWTTPLVDV
jgi:hypothetical protein